MGVETQGGFVSTNGIRTYYEEAGRGPEIVFVHGVDLNLTYWWPQLAYFSRWYRAVAYDLRGMGRSSGAKPPYPFEAFVEDLAAFLDALGMTRPVLCGHSLGGDIILQYGISRPGQPRALVVADAPPPYSRITSKRAYKNQKLAIGLLDLVPGLNPLKPMARMAQRTLYSRAFQGANPAAMKAFRRQYASNSVDGVLNAAAALACRSDNTPDLPGIIAPTLLLRGSKDRVVHQRDVETYRDQIAGSTLGILEGSGHMTLQEQPERFNHLMHGFLRLLDWGGAGRACSPRRPSLYRAESAMSPPTASPRTIRWGRVLFASLVGTVLFVAVGFLIGAKPLSYGAVFFPGGSETVQLAAGVAAVLISCLGYGVLFAVSFSPVSPWKRVAKAVYFAFIAAFISIMIMPGAAAIDSASSWPRYIEFLAFSLGMSLLYTGGQR